jgi:hypothetical protein
MPADGTMIGAEVLAAGIGLLPMNGCASRHATRRSNDLSRRLTDIREARRQGPNPGQSGLPSARRCVAGFYKSDPIGGNADGGVVQPFHDLLIGE